jgi:transcriptional regulator with XRE-family HTH domain
VEADEIKRRMVAARTLRQLTQDDLDTLGADYGLDKQELSRLERGELPLTRVRRDALARLLHVSERWFRDEDVNPLLNPPGQAVGGEEIARRALAQLMERLVVLDELRDRLAALEAGTEQTARDQAAHDMEVLARIEEVLRELRGRPRRRRQS